MFCLFQKFTGEYQHRVRRVAHLPSQKATSAPRSCLKDRRTHLVFLGLRSHHEEFSSRMHHLNFSNDCGCVRCYEHFTQMIDQQLVPTFDGPISRIRQSETRRRGRKTHRWARNLSSQDLITLLRLEYSVVRHLQDPTGAIAAQKNSDIVSGRKKRLDGPCNPP